MDREKQYLDIHKEAFNLFQKKNKDYGDAFADYGSIGVLVRLGDKIRRCQSTTNSGIQLVNDESLRDTLIDLHNYSAMAIMLMDEGDNKINNFFNKIIKKNIEYIYKYNMITDNLHKALGTKDKFEKYALGIIDGVFLLFLGLTGSSDI